MIFLKRIFRVLWAAIKTFGVPFALLRFKFLYAFSPKHQARVTNGTFKRGVMDERDLKNFLGTTTLIKFAYNVYFKDALKPVELGEYLCYLTSNTIKYIFF